MVRLRESRPDANTTRQLWFMLCDKVVNIYTIYVYHLKRSCSIYDDENRDEIESEVAKIVRLYKAKTKEQAYFMNE